VWEKAFVAFFPLDGIKKRHELFPTPNIIDQYLRKTYNFLINIPKIPSMNQVTLTRNFIMSYRNHRLWITIIAAVSTSVSPLIEESVAPFPGRNGVRSSQPTRDLTSKRGSIRGKIAHLPCGNHKTAKDVAISRDGCGHSSFILLFPPSFLLYVSTAFNNINKKNIRVLG